MCRVERKDPTHRATFVRLPGCLNRIVCLTRLTFIMHASAMGNTAAAKATAATPATPSTTTTTPAAAAAASAAPPAVRGLHGHVAKSAQKVAIFVGPVVGSTPFQSDGPVWATASSTPECMASLRDMAFARGYGDVNYYREYGGRFGWTRCYGDTIRPLPCIE